MNEYVGGTTRRAHCEASVRRVCAYGISEVGVGLNTIRLQLPITGKASPIAAAPVTRATPTALKANGCCRTTQQALCVERVESASILEGPGPLSFS